MSKRESTHWHECWRVHHECAIARLEAFEAALDHMERKYDGPEEVRNMVRKLTTPAASGVGQQPQENQ